MKKSTIINLSLSQWWWVFEAYWRLWWVHLRTKMRRGSVSNHWLRTRLAVVSEPSKAQPGQLKKAILMHEAVRLASRLHWIEMACLPRSIVLVDMLNSKERIAMIKLGVNKQHDKLVSHAWVEVGGVMVAEPESVADDFMPL